MIDPHGMDPETVLRFVAPSAAGPGKVVVIGCEPRRGRRGRPRADAAGRGRGRAARWRWCGETIDELRTDAAYAALMHELSLASAVVDTARRATPPGGG